LDGRAGLTGRWAKGEHGMADTDVLVEPQLDEPDDRPVRFTARRMLRWAVVLTVGILVVLAIWQEPLYAL
jgi:hypothetical protein